MFSNATGARLMSAGLSVERIKPWIFQSTKWTRYGLSAVRWIDMGQESNDAIRLVSTETLAEQMGYAGPNTAFREWCASLGITPVPGRRGWYDIKLVRRRLDEAQGLSDFIQPQKQAQSGGLVERRRARRSAG